MAEVKGGEPVAGRLCAIRKTRRERRPAVAKLRVDVRRRQRKLRPETLEYAKYVIVLTTFPEADLDAWAVLRRHRLPSFRRPPAAAARLPPTCHSPEQRREQPPQLSSDLCRLSRATSERQPIPQRPISSIRSTSADLPVPFTAFAHGAILSEAVCARVPVGRALRADRGMA